MSELLRQETADPNLRNEYPHWLHRKYLAYEREMKSIMTALENA